MTQLESAFKTAGYDTTESLLRSLVTDTIREKCGNLGRAQTAFVRQYEDDVEFVRWAGAFVFRHFASLQSGGQESDASGHRNHASALHPSNRGKDGRFADASNGHHSSATPDRGPSPEHIRAAMRVASRIAVTILDSVKTSDGRAWGDVGAHELDGMERDGTVAKVVKQKLGVLSNSQRFKTLRELMRPSDFDAALRAAREEQVHAAA